MATSSSSRASSPATADRRSVARRGGRARAAAPSFMCPCRPVEKSVEFEDTRYNRQEMMPQVGPDGQRLLAAGSVVSVGAGGVKSPLLYYLAAAGVGRIHIVDFDQIELSNLNRQILYRNHDIGRSKALTAAEELTELNPSIDVSYAVERISEANIKAQLAGFDVLLEGGDGPE